MVSNVDNLSFFYNQDLFFLYVGNWQELYGSIRQNYDLHWLHSVQGVQWLLSVLLRVQANVLFILGHWQENNVQSPDALSCFSFFFPFSFFLFLFLFLFAFLFLWLLLQLFSDPIYTFQILWYFCLLFFFYPIFFFISNSVPTYLPFYVCIFLLVVTVKQSLFFFYIINTCCDTSTCLH